MAEFIETHGAWIRWALPLVFASGMAWVVIQTVPAIEKRVQEHDVKLAIVETKLDGIAKGIDDIRETLRRGNR